MADVGGGRFEYAGKVVRPGPGDLGRVDEAVEPSGDMGRLVEELVLADLGNGTDPPVGGGLDVLDESGGGETLVVQSEDAEVAAEVMDERPSNENDRGGVIGFGGRFLGGFRDAFDELCSKASLWSSGGKGGASGSPLSQRRTLVQASAALDGQSSSSNMLVSR